MKIINEKASKEIKNEFDPIKRYALKRNVEVIIMPSNNWLRLHGKPMRRGKNGKKRACMRRVTRQLTK